MYFFIHYSTTIQQHQNKEQTPTASMQAIIELKRGTWWFFQTLKTHQCILSIGVSLLYYRVICVSLSYAGIRPLLGMNMFWCSKRIVLQKYPAEKVPADFVQLVLELSHFIWLHKWWFCLVNLGRRLIANVQLPLECWVQGETWGHHSDEELVWKSPLPVAHRSSWS